MLEARYVEAEACEPARTFLAAGMLSFVTLAGKSGLLKLVFLGAMKLRGSASGG